MNLTVENITLEDVQNTGTMFDGQDPAVTLTIGKTKLKTARLKDADPKKAATFPDRLIFTLTDEELKGLTTQVVAQVDNVDDKGVVKKNIGNGSALLHTFAPIFGTPFQILLKLSYDEGKGKLKEKGTLRLTAKVERVAEAAAIAAPATAAAVTQPAAAAPIAAAQPVASPAIVANQPAAATQLFQPVAAAKAEPEAAAKAMEVTAKSVAALVEPAKPVVIAEPVKPPSAITAPTTAPTVAPMATKPVDPNSPMIELTFDNITADDLRDTGGMFDAQHPAVSISIGSITMKTARLNIKTAGHFPDRLLFTITEEEFHNASTNMTVYVDNVDEKGTVKKSIGNGSALLQSFSPVLGTPCEVVIKLSYDEGKGKMKEKGTIRCTLHAEHRGADAAPAKAAAAAVAKPTTAPAPVAEPVAKAPVVAAPPAVTSNAPTPAAAAAPKQATAASGVMVSITVENIIAEDLQNTGSMFDGQDPAVTITIGAVKMKTARVKDADPKKPCTFHDKLLFVVSEGEFNNASTSLAIHVDNVDDKGTIKKNIGNGSALLQSFSPILGTLCEVSIKLSYDEGKGKMKEKGIVRFTLRAESKPADTPVAIIAAPAVAAPAADAKTAAVVPPVAKPVPVAIAATAPSAAINNEPLNPNSKINLTVHTITAEDLQNTGSMFDGQDPAITLMIGSITMKTARVKDADLKKACVFPNHLQFVLSYEEFTRVTTNMMIKVDNVDDKGTVKKNIGSGSALLQSFSPVLGTPCEVTIKLSYDEGKDKVKEKGSVRFTILAERIAAVPTSVTAPNAASTVAGKADGAPSTKFTAGTLKIKKIICQNMKNVEKLTGNNDPYVILTLAGLPEYQTEVAEEAGANCTFDYLDCKFPVDQDLLDFELLRVQIMDHNHYTGPVLIGKCEIPLTSLAKQANQGDIDLPMTITNDKGITTGRVIITVELISIDTQAVDTAKLLESFTGGVINLHTIRVFDVPDMEGKKMTVKLSYETEPSTYAFTTPVLNLNVTPQAVYESLDQTIPITKESLQAKELQATVCFHSMFHGESVVAAGSVSLLTILSDGQNGKECQVMMNLARNGAQAGHLSFFLSLQTGPVTTKPHDLKLPDTFTHGYILLESITLSGLIHKELMSSLNPYVICQFATGNWKQKTSTLTGADVKWESLPYKLDITRADLESNKLELQVYDDNTIQDVIVGQVTIDFRDFLHSLNTDCTATYTLIDPKSKAKEVISGRVKISSSLHQALPDAKDITIAKELLPTCFIKLHKITGKDLKTGNLLGRVTPTVELTYGNTWKWTTITAGGGDGTNPVWDMLDIESVDFNSELISTTGMTVTLYDNNKPIASGEILSIITAAMQAGNEVPFEVDVLRLKNKNLAGKITVFLSLLPPSGHKIPLTVPEGSDDRKPDFIDGLLCITSIRITEMKNTEMFGGQADPFVVIKFKDAIIAQTAVLENAGSMVLWDNLTLQTEVLSSDLLAMPLEVMLYEHNNILASKLLGTAKLNIKRLAFSPGKEIELTGNINDSNNTKVGKFLLVTEVKKVDPKDKPQLPATINDFELQIMKISAFGLQNKGFSFQLDPFVEVKIGEFFFEKTTVMNKTGSDVIFDNLMMRVTLPKEAIQTGQIELFVKEVGMSGNTLLGIGSAALRGLTALNKEFQIPVTITAQDGSASGRLLIFLKLANVPPAASMDAYKDMKVTVGYTTGSVTFDKVCGYKLKNTNLLPGVKNSPFVEFKIGENGSIWSGSTPTAKNAGSYPVWDLLDLSTSENITADILQREYVEVVVKNDRGAMGKDIIGVGRARLLLAGSRVGQAVEMVFDLYPPAAPATLSTATAAVTAVTEVKSTAKSTGRIICNVTVRPAEPPEDTYKVPASFIFGTLKINQIHAVNLKRTEWLTKQDPFVDLKLADGSWSGKTHTMEDADTMAKWEHLPLEIPLYANQAADTPLEITVANENTARGADIIGKAKISLAKMTNFIEQEVQYKATLLDNQNKPAGKITLFMTLFPPEPEIILPSTFLDGQLFIQRISVFGMPNYQFLGLSKLDPFVTLQLDQQKVTTTQLFNIGGNPSWESLDYVFNVDKKAVSSADMILTIFDSGPKQLGTAKLQIKQFAKTINSNIEIIADILTVKENKFMGKVNILGRLQPSILTVPTVDPSAQAALPSDFTVGMITIQTIKASGLRNTETLGKQDPYVKLTIDDTSETTVTLQNAGSTPQWEHCNVQLEVNKELLTQERMIVEVWEQNDYLKGDVLLGTGTISLRKLLPRFNNFQDITCDLKDITTQALCGSVTLSLTLTAGGFPQQASEQLPESAVTLTKGMLTLTTINAYDLPILTQGMMSTAKPGFLIEVRLENSAFTARTPADLLTATNTKQMTWENLGDDITTAVDRDTLLYKKLIFLVKDSRSPNAEKELLRGELGLRSVGAKPLEIEGVYTVRLKDARGRGKSRLEVKILMHKIPELPPSSASDSASKMTPGVLQIIAPSLKDLPPAGMLGASSYYLQFKCAAAPSWSYITTPPTKPDAGNNIAWKKVQVSLPLLHPQHLLAAGGGGAAAARGGGISIDLVSKSMLGQDTVIGTAMLSPPPTIFSASSETAWIDSKVLLKDPKNDKVIVGKFGCQMRFVSPDQAAALAPLQDDEDAPPPAANDSSKSTKPSTVATAAANNTSAAAGVGPEHLAALKVQQELLSKKVSSLETGLKSQMQQEFADERQHVTSLLESQNLELKKTLDKLTKSLLQQQLQAQPKQQQESNKIVEMKKLELPKDIDTWRTAHVQAWLAFDMELPNYLPSFAAGAVDGKVLIRHVNEQLLLDPLHVDDPLHRAKLLTSIDSLRTRQERLIQSRLDEAAKRKAEEEKQRKMAAKDLQKQKKQHKKKKHKPSSAAAEQVTRPPGTNDNHGLERVRLERDMRLLHDEERKRRKLAEKRSHTWNFEYTNKPRETGVAQTIWDQIDTSNKSSANTAYSKAMLSRDLAPPIPTKIKTIPGNVSTEEVLAIVKAAMFEVGGWLAEVEKMRIRREMLQDDDLEPMEYYNEDYYEYEVQTGDEREPDHDDEDEGEAPPSYEEVYLAHLNHDSNEEEEEEEPPPYDLFLNHDEGEDDEEPPPYDDLLLATTDPLPVAAPSAPPPPQSASINKTLTFAPSSNLNTGGSSASKFSSKRGLPTRSSNSSSRRQAQKAREIAEITVDRMSVIFEALVGQHNNHAAWLGANPKLTRLKLEGGIESLLRLKLTWTQFDSLWTKLDYRRTGDVDLQEFKRFFGDLDEFQDHEGAVGLSLTGPLGSHHHGHSGHNSQQQQQESLSHLTKALYALCDALRKAGFTVADAFKAFDRDASGAVSLSEFCSLLRTVLGPAGAGDRRMIYQALSVLDTDGDKQISLEETLLFIYRVWKTQLDDLTNKVYDIDAMAEDENNDNDTAKQEQLKRKLLREREDLKSALKRNFPRAWRDNLEQRGGHGHAIPGPFANLLRQMQLMDAPPAFTAGSTWAGLGHEYTATAATQQQSSPQQQALSPVKEGLGRGYTPATTSHSQAFSSTYSGNINSDHTMASSPGKPRPSSANAASGSRPHRNLATAGHSQLLRLKIRMPSGMQPTRTRSIPIPHDDIALMDATGESDRLYNSMGPQAKTKTVEMTLQTPHSRLELGKDLKFSAETTGKILRQSEVGSMGGVGLL